jgi:hypothetical protein
MTPNRDEGQTRLSREELNPQERNNITGGRILNQQNSGAVNQ